ncbi:MAG: T9SS type A sorting domain-containing protein [Flavobacteriaceae bacterium]|nr:T9SS type A sorting domain-containing protein [Flavobacteriaceae bacterium]
MKKNLLWFFTFCFVLSFSSISAQKVNNDNQKPVWSGTLNYKFVPSIAQQIKDGTFIPADPVSDKKMIGKDKRWHGNKVVPGKGLPKGPDPLLESSNRSAGQRAIKSPTLTFETTASTSTPSDPTGAVGPNHYVASWNTAWRIFNKDGTPATAAASLSTLFGTAPGDPVVLYDEEADRFIVMEFDGPDVGGTTNGFHIAISQGSDPVNSGWHVYSPTSFGTGNGFPDYQKISIWSDGYYVTANISGGNGQLWALERDKMLVGDTSASIQAFNLTGIVTNGFYSPQVFNISGGAHPASGNATVVYQQDDAWAGVATDHLKLWTLNIDWTNSGNSTISAPTEVDVTAFTGVFDGGSFSNLAQPSGPDIDAMQATIMNQAQFRKFTTHNSAVFNFVVNTDGSGGELAGVRWYEMRQTADGQPWTIYQEGTYTAPGGRHAFAASIGMNADGDIGMGYSSLSNTESISLRYTGRLDGDALGVMSSAEGLIVQSTGDNPNLRYADYSHLTIDPTDGSFWFVSEYFNPNRADMVGVFDIVEPSPNDVGVSSIDSPNSGVLGATEAVTISIMNFGTNAQSNVPVSYTIDGGAAVNETYTGTIAAGTTESYTFTQTADLSVANQTYAIVATTNLTGDENNNNDSMSKNVTNAATLCEPAATLGCNLDGIKKFVLGTIDADDGGNGCNGNGQGYVDRRDMLTDLDRASGSNAHLLQAQQNWTSGIGVEQLSVWIDFDDNGTFESSERLISGETFTAAVALSDFTLNIPVDGALGNHVLRAKAIDGSASGDVLDPCSDFDYGEVHDYMVNIVDTALNVNDFTLDASEFSIVSLPNNQYEIVLKTGYDKDLSFSLFNVLGQQVVFNNISKENGVFRYELDMSYASSGVYIVKLGKGDVFETGKIIVE